MNNDMTTMPEQTPHIASLLEHEKIAITCGRRSGLTIIATVHNTLLGPAFGGCRLWRYPDWTDALSDALRLSQGMTYKNALAGLHAGGGKSVIHIPAGESLSEERRCAAFLDLGDAVESFDGLYVTAEDVGSSVEDMLTVAQRTAHVRGLPTEAGGSGDPSGYTARGVYSALQETLRRVTGSPSCAGRRITIAGVGHVGRHLAVRLANEGAELALSDLDTSKKSLAEVLGASWVAPEEAHTVPADVFMPAGVGGMLSDQVIDQLAAAAVVGPANNQLAKSDSAEKLSRRGILYAPDYLVNAGGVLFLGAEQDPLEERLARIDAIGSALGRVYDEADDRGITTAEAANRLVRERLSLLATNSRAGTAEAWRRHTHSTSSIRP
ncbi:Glu/Leu/Phe/Val family dehydrogenase [Nesterenkonia ebinurensis]|uniref:Glu/Leu/Phe/Val family dehydrogenase n=1 Tax=Nesterenkonia ebinurensis TaxID=2608252 RepID=UPI00123CB063|nr:Glu/Leu/Phe/Val dehydrogenase dimerization domain-containing protein [Nesterenkonia ebinurensis]